MDKEQKEQVLAALVNFVLRVAKEGGTAEEVVTLPAVAELLLDGRLG